MDETVSEAHENGREMVLNLSVWINEAQNQERIPAKRMFFFSFIEKEVAALRYQLAQERNYEQKKEPKKSERTFAGKEDYKRDDASSRPTKERDGQAGKTFNKLKKKCAPVPVSNWMWR